MLAFPPALAGGDMMGVVERLSVENDALVVIARPGCECLDRGQIAATWRTTDLVSWERTESPWEFALSRQGPIQGGRGLLRVNQVWRTRVTSQGLIEEPPRATIETSVDGARWTRVYRGAEDTDLLGVLAYDGGFIAYGDYLGAPLIVTSVDGRNWATADWDPANSAFYVRRLLDLDGRLVLLGQGYSSQGYRESAAWVSPTLPAPIVAVRPSEPPGGLLAVGGLWQAEPPLPARVRDATAVSLPDGRIAMIGGGLDFQEPTSDVTVYDPFGGSATELPPLPVAIENVPAVSLPDGELLVFTRRASYSLAPGAAQWRVRAPMPGACHAYFLCTSAALGDDGLVYVAAGGRRIYVYDPRRDAWRASLRVPVPTGAQAVVAADGAILVVTVARVWIYSLADGEWTPGPARLRASFGTIGAYLLADGRLVVLARDVLVGECSSANVRLTVEVLDRARTRWALGPTRPSILASASAVIGDRVFLLGGVPRTISQDCGWSGTSTVAQAWSLELAP